MDVEIYASASKHSSLRKNFTNSPLVLNYLSLIRSRFYFKFTWDKLYILYQIIMIVFDSVSHILNRIMTIFSSIEISSFVKTAHWKFSYVKAIKFRRVITFWNQLLVLIYLNSLVEKLKNVSFLQLPFSEKRNTLWLTPSFQWLPSLQCSLRIHFIIAVMLVRFGSYFLQ